MELYLIGLLALIVITLVTIFITKAKHNHDVKTGNKMIAQGHFVISTYKK